MSDLEYKLEVAAWPKSRLTVQNGGSVAVSSFQFRAILRSLMSAMNGYAYHWESTADDPSVIPSGGEIEITCGDITDVEIEILFEVEYQQGNARHLELLDFPPFDSTRHFDSPLTPLSVVHGDPRHLRFPQAFWYRYVPINRLWSLISLVKGHDLVLLLGHDSGGGLMRLKEIERVLSSLGYQAIILREAPDVESQSLEEKLLTYALLCQFAIVDDREPSGHIDELNLVVRNRVIAAVLRSTHAGGTFMQADYDLDFRNVRFWDVAEPANLESVLREVTGWASSLAENRAMELTARYPWRRQS